MMYSMAYLVASQILLTNCKDIALSDTNTRHIIQVSETWKIDSQTPLLVKRCSYEHKPQVYTRESGLREFK